VVFYKLLRIDYSKTFSFNIVFLLSIFPTAYFFSLPYTESLFLLLVVLTLYFARKKNWWAAGIYSSLAILTRNMGVILIPTPLFEWYQNKKEHNLSSLLGILIPPMLGVATYMAINKMVLGNYLAFREILETHWHKKATLPIVSIKNSINTATSKWNSHAFMIGYVEVIFALVAWTIAFFSIKKIRGSYALYTILGTVVFTSTGFLLSTPRYILSVPTLFIVLAFVLKNNKGIENLWILISVMLLSYFSLMYVSGFWAF